MHADGHEIEERGRRVHGQVRGVDQQCREAGENPGGSASSGAFFNHFGGIQPYLYGVGSPRSSTAHAAARLDSNAAATLASRSHMQPVFCCCRSSECSRSPPQIARSQSAAAKPSKNTKAPSAATLANYKTHCQPCHLDGNAPQALMNFADGDWRYGSTLKEVTKNIADGVRGTPMEGLQGQADGNCHRRPRALRALVRPEAEVGTPLSCASSTSP